MKTKLTSKNNLVFFFIFISIHLFSQNPLSVILHFNHGLSGIDPNGLEVAPFGITTYSVKYGGDLSIGIGFNYFIDEKRKFSFNGSILWNYYSFQRKEESSFTPFGGMTTANSSRSQYYQAHSILFPMKWNKHLGQLSFTLGLVPRFRLQTKMTSDYINLSATSLFVPSMINYNTRRYKAGAKHPTREGIVDLKYKIDLQYVAGINYHINDELAINIEFRNIILENNLMYNGDVIGEPNAGTISFGMSWKIF